MALPEINEQCNEKHPTDDLKGLKKLRASYCPEGVCIKVRATLTTEDGSFRDTFVVRDCWSHLWPRPYIDQLWANCSDVPFVGDAGKICSCQFDL
uniref:Uncharacterized protein n=1 Tax=Romanomermis culicivorax TaxID=13658 RepID=A0A915K3X2_ROMCU